MERTTDRARAHVLLELREHTASGAAQTFTLGEFDLPFLRAGSSLETFVQIRERMVERVLQRLAPAFELPATDPARPENVEAYRLYLQASGRVLQRAVCDAAVLDLARRSLDIDPDYRPGWVLLGWAHYGRVSACGEGTQHYDEALRAAARAAALDPSDPEPILLEAVTMTERGRLEEAYERILRGRRAAGASPQLAFAAAYVLTYAGHLVPARQALDEALALHPLYLTEGGWTPNVLLYQQQFDRFLSLLPGTDTPIFRWYRGLAELERGRSEDARRAMRGVFERHPQDVFGRLSLATVNALDGRPADARSAVMALAQHRETVGSRDGEFTLKQAQVLSMVGDLTSALDLLARAVDQGFVCVPCIDSSRLLDPLRTGPGYEAIVTRARARHAAFGRRFGLPVQ
jgi:tetratricopeptide (TPR) repeat protein